MIGQNGIIVIDDRDSTRRDKNNVSPISLEGSNQDPQSVIDPL